MGNSIFESKEYQEAKQYFLNQHCRDMYIADEIIWGNIEEAKHGAISGYLTGEDEHGE